LTDSLLKKYISSSKQDIITTLTHIVAYTIAESYRNYILESNEIDEVFVCGGGANNQVIIDLIKEYSAIHCIKKLDDLGYSIDYMEALAFVILANETIQGNPSNVPSATGAMKPVILGQISKVIK